MPTSKEQEFKCPLGDQGCQWLEHISKLQSRVDELAQLVSQDPLTGLHNLRHFNDILPQTMERTRRLGHASGLIMIDLDNFKAVNDTWGHEIGNLTLKQAGTIMTQQVRMVDTVCRYGGEEFVVVLPDTQLRQCVKIAERIRKSIEATPLIFSEGEVYITASMGIEVYQGETQMTSQALVHAADKLLYQAKHAGRNQVAHRDFAEVESTTAVSQEEIDALFKGSDVS
ncbi:MAG: GGDEF domain-containing protein [Pseudomonadales bacterium]|jgi:diguanylate cyclase (GGDEF)-like protein|nr:GGDEF domain-containing protein [Pseudomonadales bacterium]MDP7358862.1 GGDEF domain-containing protein [Pseudomonadales bacterium]MDP7595051.1 GGDEF domain-containing protein [Pseudomonadales bacterium]HJN52673.1 GGDEF domain-containing protein [Pseudomonadales bacterium]|tara:strand:- start:1946 stop:2626 length:681 start_codon:yes stop_codon:yes gene_type:complete